MVSDIFQQSIYIKRYNKRLFLINIVKGVPMDLRVIKTKQSIKNAFLELRRKKSIEKITVRELSEIAMINKATFYLHYADIYELADEIENNTIQDIFDDIPCINNAFESPAELTKQFVMAFYRRNDIISVLFSDMRSGKLVDKIEQEIKKRTLKKDDSFEKQLMLTYIIQGSFHTAIKYKNENIEKVYTALAAISEIIIKNYVNPD